MEQKQPLTFSSWFQEVLLQLEVIADTSGTITKLFEDPMLGDPTWTALLAAQVVRRREAAVALREIVPPGECREAHEMLQSASGDNLLSAEYMLMGVQENDPDLLERGNEYTKSATAKLDLFRLMGDRLMGEAMTPASAPTAVPTATALPTLTPSSWVQEVLLQFEIIGDARKKVTSLIRYPLFGDPTWTALLAAQVVKKREADAALREIVPPGECCEAHAMSLSASGDYLLSTEYILKGLQQLDEDLIKQSWEYMESAKAKMNLFLLMLEAMTP